MTFNIVVPNAGQSPGVFPAQNNTNFSRLKTIINADHNFTDSIAASEGAHKKATFINLSPQPIGFPAGTNGILYSFPDSDGASQLRWYNGASDQQVTGGDNLLASGTAVVATNSVAVIYTLPAADGFGMIYMWVDANPTKMMSAIWTSNAAGVNIGVIPTKTPPVSTGTEKYPIFFNISLSLDISPFTSSATFNGTYNYRIYRLG